ncbi:MAG: GIY-YIG nuclease family protein [Chitinophagales bacterium]|nr:GIY-YIG nuclease family protein [Chitinophagales bacterium]OJV27032.1 MAG: hypothetical protein BGO32_11255 [Bacteroidetes bacterium 37-13]HRP39585.1 GIY-YIG nuclease family protein [Chitinophagales bacterium]
MASVYILYSESSNKFYVGYTTETVAKRLEKHNSGFYEHKYTARGKPWTAYFEIECESVKQAVGIEKLSRPKIGLH